MNGVLAHLVGIDYDVEVVVPQPNVLDERPGDARLQPSGREVDEKCSQGEDDQREGDFDADKPAQGRERPRR